MKNKTNMQLIQFVEINLHRHFLSFFLGFIPSSFKYFSAN